MKCYLICDSKFGTRKIKVFKLECLCTYASFVCLCLSMGNQNECEYKIRYRLVWLMESEESWQITISWHLGKNKIAIANKFIYAYAIVIKILLLLYWFFFRFYNTVSCTKSKVMNFIWTRCIYLFMDMKIEMMSKERKKKLWSHFSPS